MRTAFMSTVPAYPLVRQCTHCGATWDARTPKMQERTGETHAWFNRSYRAWVNRHVLGKCRTTHGDRKLGT
jgi:hypothetical protein